MKTLYIISRSPFMRLETNLPFLIADKDDAILLIQNGVIFCKSQPEHIKKDIRLAKERGVKLYVCKEDLEVRGLSPSCQPVSYEEIIDLFEKYSRIV